MTWKAGYIIFDKVIEALNNADVDDSLRKSIYEELIPAFEEEDCDSLEECVGVDKVFDSVWKDHLEAQKEEEDEFEKEEWEDYE